jgi:hypothetical protein
MHLPNMESVFAQLVQQEDTNDLAHQLVEVIKSGNS